MPRIGNNISTNSSSEIISSAESDSDSSSSTDSSFGSGDEGVPRPTVNTTHKKATDADAPECNFPQSQTRFFLGLFCPGVFIMSTIAMILSGNELNNPTTDFREASRAIFAAGGAMMAVSALCTFVACATTSSSSQATNA